MARNIHLRLDLSTTSWSGGAIHDHSGAWLCLSKTSKCLSGRRTRERCNRSPNGPSQPSVSPILPVRGDKDCRRFRESRRRFKFWLVRPSLGRISGEMVAKVEFHSGELFPRVGFIVTNLEAPSRTVVRFYNKRGTAEQWIKEGKQAVKMTRLSCHRFRSNQVRLGLSVLAYNLGNLWRRLALPKRIENWALT